MPYYADSMQVAIGALNGAQVFNDVRRLDSADLFGKPVLKWSDDDIATALRVYRDCEQKERIAGNLMGFWENQYKDFEHKLHTVINGARNLEAQTKAQQQAKIELEKAQAEAKRAQAEEWRWVPASLKTASSIFLRLSFWPMRPRRWG
jgi:nucleotide-binding universal stress UspA family protein